MEKRVGPIPGHADPPIREEEKRGHVLRWTVAPRKKARERMERDTPKSHKNVHETILINIVPNTKRERNE